ncbi:hypothetical protein [Pararobbsia alpina]|uniref:Uncharacterized protein n=1 Tax=Pararobbsia alpina TaxID=621374 RepID=A0A6S7BPX8_9BURK|nr:hypothetical protein [Pararobbsia alpina]CAB3795594.1 hypothetical protein LMG28138_03911 [Pararobbsia alpina]
MSKLTAALLSAFVSFKRVSASLAARIHSFLIDLHVASLEAMVERAEARAARLFRVADYHSAAHIEATTVAQAAALDAQVVTAKALADAAAAGATLSV